MILWGGWLLVTAAVFSFSKGVIHTYYTVALAPAIAALVAIGAAMFWSRRESLGARAMAALAVGTSAGWAYALLERTPSWEPWLRPVILITGALAVVGLLAAPYLGRPARRVTLAAAILGVVAAMAGPVAYAADTITTPHTGSIVSAGPATSKGGLGGLPGGGGKGGTGGPPGGGQGFGGPGGGTRPSPPSGGGTGQAGTSGSSLFGSGSSSSSGGARSGSSLPGGGGGGTTASAALVKALKSEASSYRWVAATSGSQSAATLELASGEAVMGIGGFNNEGGNLSLSAFEQLVEKGEIHYYVGSGSTGGGPGGGGTSSSIASWVKAHYTAKTIGGQTVYDLTSPLS